MYLRGISLSAESESYFLKEEAPVALLHEYEISTKSKIWEITEKYQSSPLIGGMARSGLEVLR